MYRKTRSNPVWITFGLGLALSTVFIGLALTESFARNKQWSSVDGPGVYPGPTIDTLISFTQHITIPIYFLSLMIAASATVMTVHRLHREDYTMITLTNVPDWKLLCAHLLETLQRWRFPLIFLLGIAPLQIAIGLLPDLYWCGVVRYGVCWSAGSPILNGFTELAKVVGLWFTIILAVTQGVWFGLWWRNTINALIGTTGLFLAILGILAGIQDRNILGFQLYRLTYNITVNIFGMKDNPFLYNTNWAFLTYSFVPLVLLVPTLYLGLRNVRKSD